jgi:multiple RNA-binding domain-containing protein 1
VDGHALEVAISSNKSSSSQNTTKKSVLSTNGKKTPTKIIVRNVPFQATRQELLKLFGTFGQLRKVRLPKKFDGNHRGFAFVEFLTGKEALAAMNALSRTHLYGRHLVLEWASDEDDNIDKLRDKAKRDTAGVTTAPKNKKIRFE